MTGPPPGASMPTDPVGTALPAAAGDPTTDPGKLRHILGRFATGVTVVTVGGDHPHGMTANAFASVSLRPPLVMVCVERDARMHRLLKTAEAFGISVLAADQAATARYFADRDRPYGAEQFGQVDWSAGRHTGVPLIDGAVGWLECRPWRVYDGGDHSIFLGQLVSASPGQPDTPLVFHDGRLRRLVEGEAATPAGARAALPPAARRQPPGPPGLPLVGDLHRVARDRLGLMVSAVRDYGDAVQLRMGPRRLYLFNAPEHVRHVLSENHGNYRKGLGLVHARRALGNGLLTSDGERWRRQRRAVQPMFQRERVAAAADVIVDEAERMLARWHRQPGVTIDLVPELTQLTLGVLGRWLLHTDLSGSELIGRSFEAVQDQAMFEMVTLNLVPPWLPLPRQLRFRGARRELDRLVARLLVEHRQQPADRDGLLSRLIRSDGGDAAAGNQRLRDELVTLLLAGHETTASTLGWTWYLLCEHPDVLDRLHHEATAVLGERRPSYEDMARLPYTTQVVEEAIRLYPPVWMLTRRAIEADEIGGYPVPAGADVLVCPYTLHRNPRYWPAPDRFDPERFGTEQSRQRPRYTYIPFGAGPRVCVGSNLGMLEAVLVVAMIAREFRPRRVGTGPVLPEPMLSLRLRGGLPMALTAI